MAVVGPFAPSQMIFALTSWAFFRVIAFSTAAGSRTSTSNVKRSSNGITSASANPVR